MPRMRRVPENPEEVRMSFGEHLEELRSRVLKSLLGVGLFFLAGLAFQDELLALIARPHRQAMAALEAKLRPGDPRRYEGPYGAHRLLHDLWAAFRLEPRPEPPDPEAAARQRALRKGVERFLQEGEGGATSLVAIRYPEAFLTGLKAAFILALLLGAPWTLYQLWLFVSAGLYPHERRYVRLVLPLSVGLFAGGAVFGYFVLIPFGLQFLAGIGGLPTMITLGEYFSLFLTLTLALGVVFQLPLVMVALTLLGLVRPRTYSEKRRFFILGAFVMGALLTPPDPVTQLLMAGPLLLLYEVGAWAARFVARQRTVEAPAARR